MRASALGSRTAVSIEPARTHELAPLIADAYGLTRRERSVVELVAQGLSTESIAETLHVSAWTVQDHLKAVFEKVGAVSGASWWLASSSAATHLDSPTCKSQDLGWRWRRISHTVSRTTGRRFMGKTIMGAIVSLDGFMADDNDGVGPLFDAAGNGDVAWRFPGAEYEARTTQASADFMLSQYADMAANVIGRRVFDLTNGWDGKPAAGEHVFVVTHEPPTDWEYADTAPFTFVDGVEQAIAAAKEFSGDRDVDVAAGQIGGQALKLGLIDQVVVSRVRWSSAPAGRSSRPAPWPSRCCWRTPP